MSDWRWLTKIRLRLRTLFQRRRVEAELEEEFRFHLEQRIELEMARGASREAARSAALRAMSGIEQRKEECRDMRHMNFVDDLARDLRYAARSVRHSPEFAALSVLIMALGIGANTAVFSVVNAVLLKPLAWRNANRIVTLSNFSPTDTERSALSRQISRREFEVWRSQSASFDALAYYASRETAVVRGPRGEYARVAIVSPEFFRVFSLEPVAGHFPTGEEIKRGANGVALISYSWFHSRFGGDARALHQTVRVFGLRTIVGVLPPGFRFPDNADLWVPDDPQGFAAARNYLAIGLLRPGASPGQAQAEMALIARRVEQLYPDTNKGWTVKVARMRDDTVRDVRLTLYLSLGAVGVVLLIACANTATLLLGKATVRVREVAVRATLGAGRSRIVRQLLAESLLLSLTAGLVGLLFAWVGSKTLVTLAPADLPRLADTRIDGWVLAFTFFISMLTALLFGLVPAIHALRIDLSDALKQGGTRIIAGRGIVQARGALVVAEIALAVVLVSVAGLLIRSLAALENVTLGFQPENVLVMRATMPGSFGEATPRARLFFREMLFDARKLPGVLAAGATMAPPGSIDSSGGYFIDHLPPKPEWARAPDAALSVIAPGAFAALGVPLKAGRDFSEADTPERPLVAIVNGALVRNSFRDQSPIGRKIFCPFDTLEGMTIIGVVGDVRQLGPERDPMPECYMPYTQHEFNGLTLSIVVRTIGNPAALPETLRRLARERSPEVPMKFATMEAVVSEHLAAPRFRALLLGIFAGLAVCLAMAGIYGVMAWSVAQRVPEIGLRLALGASANGVLRLVLRNGIALACTGLVIGLAASAAATRLLGNVLFEVQPNDPAVYLAVAILVSSVALLATWIPARRAAAIDPLAAIREE